MTDRSSVTVSGLLRVALAIAFVASLALTWSDRGTSVARGAAAPAAADAADAKDKAKSKSTTKKKKKKKKSKKSKSSKSSKGDKAKAKASFSTTKKKADGVDQPMAAVMIWQEYIDSDPADSKDLEKAKAEIAKWQKLADEGAEKIKGKWVGGKEREEILAKAKALSDEGWSLFQSQQTILAVKKLQESAEVYPNSFDTNFLLGYMMAQQDKDTESLKYFNEALRVRPGSPEAMSNIAVLQSRKKKYNDAIQSAYKAALAFDHPAIAQNLVASIAAAPRAMRKNKRNQEAIDAAKLLCSRYGLDETSTQFLWVPPLPREERADGSGGGGEEQPRAGMSSGTGFAINDEGLILTNRHVVDEGKTFMVLLPDGGQASAELVVMDDQQDLALIKIKLDEGKTLPALKFSPDDSPPDGADCTVMGFPLLDRLGGSIKITRGIVSSGDSGNPLADVILDATVNPGNSGGPILDKYGNVMAIVSMKSIQTATEDSYGMGISAGRIRHFLSKNNVSVTPGEKTTPLASTEEIAAKGKPGAVAILVTYQ